MNCKYCGKETHHLWAHELDGKVCESCYEMLEMRMCGDNYRYVMNLMNKTNLVDAFEVFTTWVDNEFFILKFYEFDLDLRQKYSTVLRFIAVKKMWSVRFPVVIEVRVIERNKMPTLKVTMKDDSKVRNTYIFGDKKSGTLSSESDEIQYMETNISWCEKYLKDFLK